MQERLAVPYVPDGETGGPAATPRLKANVWPAGIVYGTVHDQAAWVRFNLGDGTAGEERVLDTGGDAAAPVPGLRRGAHGRRLGLREPRLRTHLVRLSNLALDLLAEELGESR